MRWHWVAVFLTSFGLARADKKIVDMTPRYVKELRACEVQERGIGTLVTRAKTFVATNPPDKVEIEKDIEKLAKGQAALATYCAEVKAMVELLEANANTPYKTVQKAIDERDNTVRAARREGKKVVEEVAPITRKLIPRVTGRTPQIEEKKQTGKFPSGRVVEFPSTTTGAWKLGGNAISDVAEYTTATATATVTTRPFSNATCDQQRKQFASKAGDEPIADLALSDAAKAIKVEWAWRYVRRDQTPHILTMMCVTAGSGGFVAIADLTPADQLAVADEMATLMVSMLAAQLAKP